MEKIHYIDKGIELFCGSNSESVAEILNIIEEGICNEELKETSGATIESGKGLTTWIYINTILYLWQSSIFQKRSL